MAKSTKQMRKLTSTFSVGKTMESDDQSKISGLEADSKRKRMTASQATLEGVPSSASIFSDLTGLPMDVATSTATAADGMKLWKTLPGTNIGFKLLKKSGWKEGSGLGISEQGRLIPLEPQFKTDRRGIGAEDSKKRSRGTAVQEPHDEEDLKTTRKGSRKEKNLSKKARKVKAEEERNHEQAFEQQFYREFWPENV